MTATRLFELLPAVYRQRDAEEGGALGALLAVIEAELRLVERDVAGLYDNWFVETCDEWVVPYIGDQLSVRGLLPVEEGSARSQRSLVANALAYRRRKGTAAVLEQLARDVTGWPAKAVEFFERLATTQHVNHPRPAAHATADLRSADALELIDGPFERASRTADVRHVDIGRGRHNIPNVGLFLWRLQPYAVERGEARPVAGPPHGRYIFSPLGNDAPLFGRPQTEREITQLAGEENVPGPLRRRPIFDELEARRRPPGLQPPPPARFFGPSPVFELFVREGAGGAVEPIAPEQLVICDLSDPDPAAPPADWRRRPADRRCPRPGAPPDEEPSFRNVCVAVDPVTGRIAFPTGEVPDRVEVSYAYAFPGDLGGGPYDRQASVAAWLPVGDRRPTWQVGVAQDAPADGGAGGAVGLLSDGPNDGRRPLVATLAEAIAGWTAIQADGVDRIGIVAVTGSGTYPEALTEAQRVRVPPGSMLALVAAGWPAPFVPGRLVPVGLRPHLAGDMAVESLPVGSADTGVAGQLVVDGLLIEGGITVLPGNLGGLRLAHCTLVPGRGLDALGEPREPERPSLVVRAGDGAGDNDRLRVRIERSITGPLRLPSRLVGLEVVDSIVDSPTRGGRAFGHPALVSGPLSTIALTAPEPTLLVTIGEEGPRRVAVPFVTAEPPRPPQTVAEARDALEIGLRRAPGGSAAFRRARVITVPGVDRLIVLPGLPAPVVIEPDGDNPTAAQLRLDREQARSVGALIGGRVAIPADGAIPPAPVLVTIGEAVPRQVALAGAVATVAQARDALQAAIRAAADGSEAFAAALVANIEDRLVVVPGVADKSVRIAAPPGARTGLLALALESDRPAIAADDGGDRPGPPASIERATVFGPVHVAELTASEALFTDQLAVERRQTGCVRFSYVPPEARTPRRFRCQPDREIAARLAEAERRAGGRALSDAERDAIRLAVERSAVPVFTASRYGLPAYGQLSVNCAEAIRTGAEDEGEIGAFHFLQQPQRLTNLRSALDEYLRFGLEAGVFLVT